MKKITVLLIGGGGREHALAKKISESNRLEKLYISPGNPGTAELGENIELNINDFDEFKQTILSKEIDMIVVGPEQPLVDGLYDKVKADNDIKETLFIGPSKDAAQLEGSKDFAKDFMQKYNIPTAKYKSISKSNINEGIDFLGELEAPYVLKADGLAAGKGVLIEDNKEKAENALNEMLNGKFGEASKTVVIEEFLKGIELSMFVLTDGRNYVILPEAKDYKRIGEGDTGLNTGGMGALSPVPFADKDFLKKVEERIIKPTVEGLNKENLEYKGFIFFGLMNVNGNPYVIEYNVRMGDPEAEVVLPRIKTDILELFEATSNELLHEKSIEISEKSASTIMLVSGGYPEKYEKGKEITGINEVEDCIVFQAGTKEADSKIVTNGGRVIAITSLGKNTLEALNKSYRNAEIINFDKKYFRKDLGKDIL